jgi:hypothetical protein
MLANHDGGFMRYAIGTARIAGSSATQDRRRGKGSRLLPALGTNPAKKLNLRTLGPRSLPNERRMLLACRFNASGRHQIGLGRVVGDLLSWLRCPLYRINLIYVQSQADFANDHCLADPLIFADPPFLAKGSWLGHVVRTVSRCCSLHHGLLRDSLFVD